MFDSWLFVTDLDGTLLNSDNEVSEKNSNAIENFKSNGGFFTIASGRNLIDVSKFFDSARPNAPFVCLNGAAVYDGESEKYLNEIFLSDKADDILTELAEKFETAALEIYKDCDIYVCRDGDGIKKHMELEAFEPIYIENIKDAARPFVKAVFWDKKEVIDKMTEFIKKYDAEEFAFVTSSHWAIELLSKRANKHFGIEKIKNHLGDKVKKVVTIGDFDNDVMMLKGADISFATANASPAAKAAATIVLDETCSENAVSKAIEILKQKIESGKI